MRQFNSMKETKVLKQLEKDNIAKKLGNKYSNLHKLSI